MIQESDMGIRLGTANVGITWYTERRPRFRDGYGLSERGNWVTIYNGARMTGMRAWES